MKCVKSEKKIINNSVKRRIFKICLEYQGEDNFI
jgi:hypothetical protein